jgi:hypothetical protein
LAIESLTFRMFVVRELQVAGLPDHLFQIPQGDFVYVGPILMICVVPPKKRCKNCDN